MKLNHLFTSILAVSTIVVTSCSTPRLAQQGAANGDDVYNSTAQAKVYVPAPVRTSQPVAEQYQEDDYYGTSDPYYDMDYSSRINRFSYGSAWRSYYDPYFYGYNNFYGGGFGIGFGGGWGQLYSPFYGYNSWGFNNWGFNNFGYGNYYGGGFGGGYYGGGFLGGGYYGGGYYTGRTTNAPDYRARPYIGRENGVGTNRGMTRAATSTTRRTDLNGNVINERSRSERYTPNARTTTAPGRTERPTAPVQARPTRTETAPARTPSYNPPARTESSRGSGSSSSGSGGGARPTRAGRG